MPRTSAIVELFNSIEAGEHRWCSGHVALDKLEAALKCSALHQVSVAAPVFGFVEIPVNRVLVKLNDDWFKRDCAKFAERHGEPPMASIHISEARFIRKRRRYNADTCSREYSDKPQPIKYDISIHSFGVTQGEYYYSLR